MRLPTLGLVAALLLTGCAGNLPTTSKEDDAMRLAIRWQRLVDAEGQTCDRCGGTHAEVRRAVDLLRRSLRPLAIQVALEERELSPQECAADIMESNRIWIAERPLEAWLGAEVGASVCGSCCSQLGETVACRTTSLAGKTYEVVPAELIVQAGLRAAAQLMGAPGPGPCCPGGDVAPDVGGSCCP